MNNSITTAQKTVSQSCVAELDASLSHNTISPGGGEIGGVSVKQVETDPVTRDQLDAFFEEFNTMPSEIRDWAFPERRDEALTQKFLQETLETAHLGIQLLAQEKQSLTDQSRELEYWNSYASSTIEEARAINRTLVTAGLTNSGVDCFINSSLQLLNAMPRDIFHGDKLALLPTLQKFLNDERLSDIECKKLRQEIAAEIVEPGDNSDLMTVIIDGKAQSQEDAAALLRLILEYVDAPKIKTTEQFILNPGTEGAFPIDGTDIPPSTMIELQLLFPDEENNRTIQQLVNDNFSSALIFDGVPAIKKIAIADASPKSLILSISRFSFDEDGPKKRNDTINDILQPISLPKEDGTAVSYEPTSIICHSGQSTNSGHYICFRKEEDAWLLYNDDYPITGLGEDFYYDEEFIKKNCYVISYEKISETADEIDNNENFSDVWLDVETDGATPEKEV